MKSRLLQVAFILSVTFNVAALATVAYNLAFAKSAASKPDAFAVYERLNLTDEQRRVLTERYFDLVQRITTSQRDYVTKWAECVDLIAQPKTDWQALTAKQNEILEINRTLQTTIFQRWDWGKTQLTPEQQQMLFAILRDRIKSGELLGEIKAAQEPLQQRTPPPK